MRPSTVQRAETAGATITHLIVGLFFMAGGGYVIRYAMMQQKLDHTMLFVGIGVAVLGALFMPTIFPLFKQIVVFVVPYIPMVGGRRAEDPPKPGAPT